MSLRSLLFATLVASMIASEMCLGENRATSIKNDFVGTAVLMPNARRSRLSRDFVTAITDESAQPLQAGAANAATDPPPTPPPSLNRDSAPTTTNAVSAEEPSAAVDGQQLTDEMYREYEYLLKMDTKNFNDKQKQLFEQIVERVARLGGSTDSPTTDYVESEVGESRGSKQRLTKARFTTTATPSSATSITKNKHSSSSSSTSTATTTKSKPSTITVKTHQTAAAPSATTVPAELAKPFAHKFKPLQTNISPVGSSAATKVGNVTEVIFGNITTTSIVDSLSNDNGRDDIFSGKKRPPTTAAAATVQTTADTNKNKVCEINTKNNQLFPFRMTFKIFVQKNHSNQPTAFLLPAPKHKCMPKMCRFLHCRHIFALMSFFFVIVVIVITRIMCRKTSRKTNTFGAYIWFPQ